MNNILKSTLAIGFVVAVAALHINSESGDPFEVEAAGSHGSS